MFSGDLGSAEDPATGAAVQLSLREKGLVQLQAINHRPVKGLAGAADVVEWLASLRRRAQETKLAGADHPVLNVVGMAAHYSPRAGAPLGLELPFELPSGRIREEVWSRWLEHDPVRFVPRRIEALRRLSGVFVDCGTRDEFNLRWGARMVAGALRAAGVEVEHQEFEDGHMGTNYRFDALLRWIAPRLHRRARTDIEEALAQGCTVFDAGRHDCNWKERWHLTKNLEYRFDFPANPSPAV